MPNDTLPDLSEFTPRLRNWKRWCIQHKVHGARAGSAEGAYSGPQGSAHPTGWGDWENESKPPVQVREFIDVNDAVKVNRGYVRLAQLAPRQAKILKVLLFRDWWKPHWQAQHLGIHHGELGEALYHAKQMLFNQCRQTQGGGLNYPRGPTVQAVPMP